MLSFSVPTIEQIKVDVINYENKIKISNETIEHINKELTEKFTEYDKLCNTYNNSYKYYPEVYFRYTSLLNMYDESVNNLKIFEERKLDIKNDLLKGKQEIDILVAQSDKIKIQKSNVNIDNFILNLDIKSKYYENKLTEYKVLYEMCENRENILRVNKHNYDIAFKHYFTLENELKQYVIKIKLLYKRIKYLYNSFDEQTYYKELNEEIVIAQKEVKNKNKNKNKKNFDLSKILILPEVIQDIVKEYIPYSVKLDLLINKKNESNIIKSLPKYFLNNFYITYKPKNYPRHTKEKYISKEILVLYLRLNLTNDEKAYKLIRAMYICDMIINKKT